MKILLLYATNSGGTFQASQTVESVLAQKGHSVDLKTPLEAEPTVLASYDLVIMGSPSWDYEDKEGQPHEDFVAFMKKSEGSSFTGKKFAIFGLGDTYYTHFCGAVDIMENFVKERGGILITPSARIDGYYAKLDEHTRALTSWSETINQLLSSPHN